MFSHMRIADRVIRSVALLALTLGFPAVALGDAYAGHHCPHHDPLPAQRHDSGHAGHTAHAGHGHDVDAGERNGHGHQHGGPCTCIGQCVTQVGAALPSPALAVAAETVPARSTGVSVTASQWVAVSPPYLLPYANAPPSSR